MQSYVIKPPQSDLASFLPLIFVLMMKERAAELVRGHEADQVLWLLDFPVVVT